MFQNISQALNDMEHVEELTKKVTALEQGQATLQRQMKRLLDVFAAISPSLSDSVLSNGTCL